jgi:hypothetical protein
VLLAKEKMVLQGLTGSLTETGSCCGMVMNVAVTTVTTPSLNAYIHTSYTGFYIEDMVGYSN